MSDTLAPREEDPVAAAAAENRVEATLGRADGANEDPHVLDE